MKKLLYSLAILFGICLTSVSQPAGYTPVYKLWSTNILMEEPTIATNRFIPGNIRLTGGGGVYSRIQINGYLVPLITFGYGNAQASITQLTNTIPTLVIATNVIIPGDLTVLGTVTGSGLVFSLTNYTTVTNAIIATNAPDLYPVVSTNMLAAALLYPTNSQSTNVDMTMAYGDLDVTDTFYFNLIQNKAATNYQTAVVLLHNTGTNASFQIAKNLAHHNVGTFYITNDTVCTIFYNPNGPKTNVICLPIW